MENRLHNVDLKHKTIEEKHIVKLALEKLENSST